MKELEKLRMEYFIGKTLGFRVEIKEKKKKVVKKGKENEPRKRM